MLVLLAVRLSIISVDCPMYLSLFLEIDKSPLAKPSKNIELFLEVKLLKFKSLKLILYR